MESSYDIAGGDTIIQVDGLGKGITKISVEVISDINLDAPIELMLRQGNTDDPDNSHPMPENPIVTDAGANSNLLQTVSYSLPFLFLEIKKLTATQGIVEFFISELNGQ